MLKRIAFRPVRVGQAAARTTLSRRIAARRILHSTRETRPTTPIDATADVRRASRVMSGFTGTVAVCAGAAALAWTYPPFELAYHPPASITSDQEPRAPISSKACRLDPTAALVERLRAEAYLKGEGDAWFETRSFGDPDPAHNAHLLPNALFGPDKLGPAPVVRMRHDGSAAAVALHAGSGLCGPAGVLHGGLLATVFDQYSCRLAFASLPARAGALAHIAVDYRAPARADSVLLLRLARVDPPPGANPRKVVVRGRLESEDGRLLAESEVVVVQPRDVAQYFKTEKMR